MAIHDTYQFHFEDVICPKTKKVFQRLTPLGVLSHHAYFYNNIFSSDSKQMIFTSYLDSNKKNFFLLDMEKQTAFQLTGDDDEVGGFGGAITSDDQYIIVNLSNKMVRISLSTFEREVIYQPEDGYSTYDTPGLSADGNYMITMDWLIKDQEIPGKIGWERFLEQSKKQIRSKLVLVNLKDKTHQIILDNEHEDYPGVRYKQWLGHPQFCNVDRHLISYCHEGLGGTVDARIWFIHDDGTHIQCPRPHDYPAQIISHEFWLKNSKKIAYVKIEKEDSPYSYIELLDADTLEHSDIVKMPRSSHFISSHDDRYIIADGDFYEDKLYLYLVDVEAGNYQPLIYHGSISYGRPGEVHAHPLFDNQDAHIIFTSDFEGNSAIYRVKL
ncbi:MAG: oligogalacturonate lyase family protein [Hungatella sp.]